MNYKKWLIEDLQNLDRDRFAIIQTEEELRTLEAEFTAIKATNYDKMPSGSGDNIQEEKMLTAIAKRDERKANLEYTRRHVADMERLLEQLPYEEMRVIEVTIMRKGSPEELGYERTNVWRLKNKALNHLARLKFGSSYQP